MIVKNGKRAAAGSRFYIPWEAKFFFFLFTFMHFICRLSAVGGGGGKGQTWIVITYVYVYIYTRGPSFEPNTEYIYIWPLWKYVVVVASCWVLHTHAYIYDTYIRFSPRVRTLCCAGLRGPLSDLNRILARAFVGAASCVSSNPSVCVCDLPLSSHTHCTK